MASRQRRQRAVTDRSVTGTVYGQQRTPIAADPVVTSLACAPTPMGLKPVKILVWPEPRQVVGTCPSPGWDYYRIGMRGSAGDVSAAAKEFVHLKVMSHGHGQTCDRLKESIESLGRQLSVPRPVWVFAIDAGCGER